MAITSRPFGVTSGGEAVTCYCLESEKGFRAEVLNYGGILRSLTLPDRAGKPLEVCLGYDSIEEYEKGDDYRGAIVGRCAGRIALGQLPLHGKVYPLSINQPPNHLHGGNKGFDRRIWQAQAEGDALRLKLHSPDGEEGYPGDLDVEVLYRWSDGETLTLTLTARAGEKDTVVSLTHHGYWNLAGVDGTPAGDQRFQVNSEKCTAMDENCLPTGEFLPVAGTPFDFRTPTPVEERWNLDDPQIRAAAGIDHTFLVPGEGMRLLGILSSPKSGVTMEISGTTPGLHLYSGNYLTPRRCALALEAQSPPDAVHHSDFPPALLPAGALWEHSISYRFSC